MIRSMTGFARRERQGPWGTLACEIRSVNHRYLELSLRLPEDLRGKEDAKIECGKAHFKELSGGDKSVEYVVARNFDDSRSTSYSNGVPTPSPRAIT